MPFRCLVPERMPPLVPHRSLTDRRCLCLSLPPPGCLLAFTGLVDDFESKAESVLQAVKASGPNIRIPGENSAKVAAERASAGPSLALPRTRGGGWRVALACPVRRVPSMHAHC